MPIPSETFLFTPRSLFQGGRFSDKPTYPGFPAVQTRLPHPTPFLAGSHLPLQPSLPGGTETHPPSWATPRDSPSLNTPHPSASSTPSRTEGFSSRAHPQPHPQVSPPFLDPLLQEAPPVLAFLGGMHLPCSWVPGSVACPH